MLQLAREPGGRLVQDARLLARRRGAVHLGALDRHQVVQGDGGEERGLAVPAGISTASSRSGPFGRADLALERFEVEADQLAEPGERHAAKATPV